MAEGSRTETRALADFFTAGSQNRRTTGHPFNLLQKKLDIVTELPPMEYLDRQCSATLLRLR